MKRFILLFSTIVLALSIMTVGASASEIEYLDGTYKLNETLSSGSAYFSFPDGFHFTDKTGETWTDFYYAELDVDYYLLTYQRTEYDFAEVYFTGGWVNEDYRTLTFDNVQVPSNFKEWILNNSVSLNAPSFAPDKSPIPGITLATEIPYPDYLPPIPDGLSGFYQIIVYTSEGETKLHTFDPNYWDVYVTDNEIFARSKSIGVYNGAHRYVYRDKDGGYWSNEIGLVNHIPLSENSVMWSATNIYYENGDLFFPLPLWAQIQGVTQGTMRVEIPKLEQTILGLLLCGIGCLALLISLPVLRKVFRRFQ